MDFCRCNVLFYTSLSICTAAVSALLFRLWISNTEKCSGLSGKTQILYAIVWTAQFSDVFIFHEKWFIALKIYLIIAAYITVYWIYIKLQDRFSRELDSFRIEYLVAPMAVQAFLFNNGFNYTEISWAFSIYLEAVAMLPQLLMLYKDSSTGATESIVVYYVIAMASYKFMQWLYNLNLFVLGSCHRCDEMDVINYYRGGLLNTAACSIQCAMFMAYFLVRVMKMVCFYAPKEILV